MKRTIQLLTISLALLFAACSKSDTGSPSGTGTIAGVSGSLARFAVTSGHLYTVSNSDLNLFNISDPESPAFQGKISLGSGIETIFPRNNALFIGTQTGMQIYDITSPGQPGILSRYDHATGGDPVVANDKYAFVTLNSSSARSQGLNQLDIIDISTLANPVLVKTYTMTKPYGLAIDGNNLFVCDGGIKFYDASDVSNLILKKSLVMEAKDVIAHDGVLMVIGNDGLYQYDYSKGDLTLLSKIPTI